MQFYETKMGNQFFNQQLPDLLSALKRIAAVMERPAPAVHLPVQVPPDYLKDLYYGNLEPDQQVDNKAIRRFTKEVIDLQDKLRQQLTPKDMALVEDLEKRLDLRSCEETAAAFQTGFSIAIKMVAAGLSTPTEDAENGGREK